MRLSEAIHLFIVHYHKENQYAIKHYLEWLLETLKNPIVSKITLVDIVKFQDGLTCSQSVKKQISLILRSFFRYVKKYYGLKFNAEEIELAEYNSGSFGRISEENIKKLHKSIDTSNILGVRNMAICKTLYDTGCRVSELVQLQRDVGDEVEVIGKRGKKRTVYLTKETQKIIGKYLDMRTDNLNCLFASHPRYLPPAPLTKKAVSNLIAILGNRIGIKCHPHQFRKAIATDLSYRSGGDIYSVKEYLGHESIKTTEIYLKYDHEKIKRFYRKYRNDCHELEFSTKKNGDVELELKGFCRSNKINRLKSAISKAIDDVLK